MEEIMQQIGNYGFPMAISIFLLVRVESKLEDLAKSINDLARAIEGIN